MKNNATPYMDMARIFNSLRIFSVLITIFLLAENVSAKSAVSYSQETNISISVKNKELKNVFREIEKKSQFIFIFNDDMNDLLKKKVSLTVKNETVDSILKKLLEGIDVSYKLSGRQIIIFNSKTKKSESSKDESQVPIIVKGIVTDKLNLPLVGVTVIVEGTNTGTITDNDGQFSLKVQEGAILTFSYLGFKSQSIMAAKEVLKIVLDEEDKLLNEVVVIGYGTQKKGDITGAISTLNSKDINKISVAGVDQALQGQVAGVQVTQSNGAPGAGIQVRIRGIGTIGDSDPLYVIDGVPTKDGVNSLNTSDIESISVLKDASSAAIYGARAANGVVLITTKKGKIGLTRVNFDMQYGIQNVAKKLDLLTADQYTMISDEALVNAGKPAVWNNPGLGKGTDWQDAVLRSAVFQKYDFSVSSGNDKTRYVLGVGHYSQDGVIKYSDFTRSNIRFNLDSKVTDKFKIGTNINLSRINENLVDTEISGVVRAAIFQPPTIPVYNTDGSYAGPGANEGDAQNPLGMAERSDMNLKKNQLFGNLFIEYNLIPDLIFKSSLGLNIYSSQSKDFNPTFSEGNANRTINSLSQGTVNYSDITWENTINYSKEFNQKHKVNLLVGNTLESVKTDQLTGYRESFSNNDEYLQYLNAGSANDQSRGNLTEWSLASFYGRANYSYLDKYLISTNVRIDGSSRFGKTNRWGVFPSVSAGWRISKESFFKVPFIDDLKLRGSWGQLGNQDIGLYAFSSVMAQSFYTFGNPQQLNVSYAPASDYNPDVKWETTTQTDLGIDLESFNSKLSFSADYYYKKTSDMLLILPQAMTSGFSTTGYENVGSIENKGLEFQFTWRDNIGDFQYSFGANLATLKNKVLSLGSMGKPINSGLFFDLSTRTEVGHSIREFYGYVTDGIFQDQTEINAHATQPGAVPGDIRFKDLNNDNKIDSNDRTFIGNPYPDFYYGINASFAYKNFDLSLLFQGQQGNDVYNGTKFWLTNSGYNFNKGTQILDRWTGPGTSNSEPRVTTIDSNQNSRASDRYIEDGSYLRLKNVQLGYTLPEDLLKKAGITKARIYFSGLNLLTFTKYSGYDPEVGMSRSWDRTIGFDEVTYPQNKSYNIGVNLTF
ncbi:SusC/RagA family TonB-linked outer membrane protein [Flavobacterium sufflavum]|uniref:SusC/RagA family TonB-linked outer membrane protein n=1 Tax=Flavobacterium sufflavum TaxID=1921138 RepID=A0A3S2XF63_9FLAO|nr:TonB-dependent receptor [Flavobacterium sufflavum]RVT77495.1 SusC/RagA family TonB-linked outer membrane protein [Flavobacterium sufflavum]